MSKVPARREPIMGTRDHGLEPPQRRCTAHNNRGERCRRAPIKGGAVCRTYGGAAPQVKLAAAERIAAMVEPALVELRRLIECADSDSVKLSAIKDVLDRAGYKPGERAEVEHRGGVTIYLPERIRADAA